MSANYDVVRVITVIVGMNYDHRYLWRNVGIGYLSEKASGIIEMVNPTRHTCFRDFSLLTCILVGYTSIPTYLIILLHQLHWLNSNRLDHYKVIGTTTVIIYVEYMCVYVGLFVTQTHIHTHTLRELVTSVSNDITLFSK